MQSPDSQDETPNPRHSMDPLESAMPLVTGALDRRAGLTPYAAPIRGSLSRPDFRGVAPVREIVPESVPQLDTHAQLERDQRRREAAQRAEQERVASMPTREELLGRRISALEADVNDLRMRLARMESPRPPSPKRAA